MKVLRLLRDSHFIRIAWRRKVGLTLTFITCGFWYASTPWLHICRGGISPSHVSLADVVVTLDTTSSCDYSLDDVVIIVKAGYAVRHRTSACISIFPTSFNRATNLLVIADYTGEVQDENGDVYPIHDVIGPIDRAMHSGDGIPLNIASLNTYRALQHSITTFDGEVPLDVLDYQHGWYLDAMKNLPGFELAFRQHSTKNWFFMMDDDTYTHLPSLLALIHRVDSLVPNELPLYLGKFLSDSPWAHGGSGILVNRNALIKLFDYYPETASTFVRQSLTAKLGDWNFGRALAAVRIPAWMPALRYFNGEPAANTRMRADRLCQPIITFHHESPQELMRTHALIDKAGQTDKVITWFDPWRWEGPPLTSLTAQSREGWNYITSFHRNREQFDLGIVETSRDCSKACDEQEGCLAWILLGGHCKGAPWFGVGKQEKDAISGVMPERIERALKEGGCAV